MHGRVDSVIMSLCCVGLGCGPGRDLSVNDERESGSRRMDMVHTHGEVCRVKDCMRGLVLIENCAYT